MKFEVKAHGNRNRNTLAHVRTKQSTKDVMAEKLKQQGTKRALFQQLNKPGKFAELTAKVPSQEMCDRLHI